MLWRDGKQATLAEVIEKRPARIAMEPAADAGAVLGGKKRGRGAAAAAKAEAKAEPAEEGEGGGGGSEGAAGFDYYVHYLGYDRRLDEWVSLDRVDLVAGPQERPHGHHGHHHGHHHHGHGHGHGHHHHHHQPCAVGHGRAEQGPTRGGCDAGRAAAVAAERPPEPGILCGGVLGFDGG